ncbi:MAG: hypothetical protein ACOYYS_09705 [Chloroflexota bacterium]
MNLQLCFLKCRFFSHGSIIIGLWLFLAACSRPTPTAVAVATATSVQSGLIATFTPTHTAVVTKHLPSATSTPTRPTRTIPPRRTATSAPTATASFITWDEAGAYVGESVTLCGPVMGAHFAESSKGQPTFLNIGENYPNPDRFTVVIWAQDRHKFPGKPEGIYSGQEICVTGTIEEYDGALEIIVTGPEQIAIQ